VLVAIELAMMKSGTDQSTMHDVKLSADRGLRTEGVVKTDWSLDFAPVGMPLKDKAKRREIDAVGLELLMEGF
jgi:hypothetical protein